MGKCVLLNRRVAGLAILLCAFLVYDAAAQFNMVTGRNHPDLNWQQAETEHFQIMYPERLEGIEAQAAAIAEESYEALSTNLEVEFEDKIRIYLSDQDEIANGFAVPVGPGHTNIWVHVNEFAEIWTSEDKWLRKVIAHEVAHIFHFEAVRSNLGLLGFLFGDALPRFWTEGLAQYLTEEWDSERGDRWLRTAVLDDDLSYEDNRSLWNPRLMYAIGNSQVRYFAHRYGDSTLVDMLEHRDPALLGLASVHNFESALQETTGDNYEDFFDGWRRHVNVYYNTLAGQAEHLDSLDIQEIDLPGNYIHDVQVSPDSAYTAAVITPSGQRPYRRLIVKNNESGQTWRVGEGSIKTPIAWHPESEHLVFARQARGQSGSLVNDLFLARANGSSKTRLTHSRRASYPSFLSDGSLAFVGVTDGTANIHLMDEAGTATYEDERQISHFEGDVQLFGLRAAPDAAQLAVSRFAADGTRDIVLVDAQDGSTEAITPGEHDDRDPVWHPEGERLAYTSLRDDVPNIFTYDFETDTHERLTHLISGAHARDWLPATEEFPGGKVALQATVTKQEESAFLLDANHEPGDRELSPPAGFDEWTTQRPPAEVPSDIAPDPTLITHEQSYRSWEHLTHLTSFGVPYFLGPSYGGGVAGLTSWMEPLGTHFLAAGAALSVIEPWDNSAFFAGYINNSFEPTITSLGYRIPIWFFGYDNRMLFEDRLTGELLVDWPLDWFARPFADTQFQIRARYMDIALRAFEDLGDPPPRMLPDPQSGRQADLRLQFKRTFERPGPERAVNPLDGSGTRLRLTGAAPILGADTEFLRGDVAAYQVLPAIGRSRLFVYGRAQAQIGEPLPQDYIGFTRTDGIRLNLPPGVPFPLGEYDRVRGYQRLAVGERVLFGTAEYRIPFLRSLNTRLLGLVSLGRTSLALFADAGMVWDEGAFEDADRRLGIGAEVKNTVSLLGGAFRFTHAFGVAQPSHAIGTEDDIELYYRIHTPLPF